MAKLLGMQVDACMIDLDGTLVDTMGDFDAVVAQMLQVLKLPALPRSELQGMVGKGSEYLIEAVLTRQLALPGQSGLAPTQEMLALAWDIYQKHYAHVNGQFSQIYPGVLKGLQGLSALGLPLVCLTNKPAALAQSLLQLKGLESFFTLTFGGDSFERKKPDPLPLLKTCEALGVHPDRALMVGDSSNDAQAAQAAGCKVVLLTYGYNHGRPARQVPADHHLDSLTQLLD
ncbi:MAG: phosphoglycolate phosphatase [Limnohabitans sp.]|jgi:phosphoglycolate phosphatase|nr:phosphoglycolate phosphatase [Burkholderiales bacterium]